MKALGASWQPKVAAIGALLTAVGDALTALADGDPSTSPDWALVAAVVVMAVGLFSARQNNVTSERAKAVKR